MRARGYNQTNDILSDEPIDERIITLQIANNVVTDDILYQYIQFCGGENLEQ